MACCAFAVLVLSQLLAPFFWWRDRFGVRRTNPAVEWSFAGVTERCSAGGRYDAQSHPTAEHRSSFVNNGLSRPRKRTVVLAALALELGLVAGVAAHWSASPSLHDDAWVMAAALEAPWCRGFTAVVGG